MGWEIFPTGLYRNLVRLKALGKPVYVTESGMATLEDDARTRHLRAHLEEVARAIRDGVDVRGYFYWSLMDNFEWAEGYARHFGLMAVDRQTLERRPRPTAFVYRDICRGTFHSLCSFRRDVRLAQTSQTVTRPPCACARRVAGPE